jgi:hypothetical protein
VIPCSDQPVRRFAGSATKRAGAPPLAAPEAVPAAAWPASRHRATPRTAARPLPQRSPALAATAGMASRERDWDLTRYAAQQTSAESRLGLRRPATGGPTPQTRQTVSIQGFASGQRGGRHGSLCARAASFADWRNSHWCSRRRRNRGAAGERRL